MIQYTRYSFRLPRPLYELFRRVGEKKYPYGFNATAFIEQAIREFIKENKELLTEDDYFIRIPKSGYNGMLDNYDLLDLYGIPYNAQGVMMPDGKVIPFIDYFKKYIILT